MTNENIASALIVTLSLLASVSGARSATPSKPMWSSKTETSIRSMNDSLGRKLWPSKAGKIIFVGSNANAKAYEGKGTRVVDLKGNTVVPGLTDSHYHLSGVGAREMNLNLEGITSLDGFLAKVKERVDSAKPGEWVTGRGLD